MPSDSCVAVQFPCFTLLTVTKGRHFCRRKCTDNFSSKIFSQRVQYHMAAKTNRDKDLEALRHKVSDLEVSMVRVNDRLDEMDDKLKERSAMDSEHEGTLNVVM